MYSIVRLLKRAVAVIIAAIAKWAVFLVIRQRKQVVNLSLKASCMSAKIQRI